MNEEEEKYYLSLLFEALGELSALSNKIHELEEKIEELSGNRLRSNTLIVENSNERAIPLSKNSFQELDYENELSDEIKSQIDHAIDYILQLGKRMPYLNK